MTRPLLAVDIDGTLAEYHGWHGPATPIGDPLPDARWFLANMRAHGWDVIAFSARPAADVRAWVARHRLHLDVWDKPGKPAATVFLDDRAVRFTGDLHAALREIEAAREPWWRT